MIRPAARNEGGALMRILFMALMLVMLTALQVAAGESDLGFLVVLMAALPVVLTAAAVLMWWR